MKGPWYVTNDSRRREAWGAPCGSRATEGLVVIDGREFRLHEAAVPAFEEWERIRAKHNYRLTGTDTGFYNCRHIQHNPALPMSYHSWGMALDVNWLENPAGNKLTTDIPQLMILDLLEVRTESGARVFRWGGDWDWDGEWKDHSYVDAMHWEVVAHPLDLETGIRRTMSDHTHKPMPDDVPRDWADGVWERYARNSGTKVETRSHTMYREDIAWVWERHIEPLEEEIKFLRKEVEDLRKMLGRDTGKHEHTATVKLT